MFGPPLNIDSVDISIRDRADAGAGHYGLVVMRILKGNRK